MEKKREARKEQYVKDYYAGMSGTFGDGGEVEDEAECRKTGRGGSGGRGTGVFLLLS